MPRFPGRRAAKLGGIGASSLTVKAAAGAAADTKINVAGLAVNDAISAVINITDGTVETVKTQVAGGITIGSTTAGDKLFVLFVATGRAR